MTEPFKSCVIAIDGPAAAGKGTLARRVAGALALVYLDTGLLYRATGMKVVRADGDPDDPATAERAARELAAADLDDDALRTDTAADAASRVAVIPAVRQALLDFQRRFAHHPPGDAKGAVLDGRDIGTVVCPDADVKLFITASTEVRANRRFQELKERGVEAIYARVLQEMKARDARDSSREVAPMAAAADAFELDTSDLDANAAFKTALSHIKERIR